MPTRSEQVESAKTKASEEAENLQQSMPGTSDHPSKIAGQYHSLKGSLTESIGNMTGSKEWKKSGREEYERGQKEYESAGTWFPSE
ncbi:hypothetical protein EYZ11_005537 [Aspergillus tanneri]|uniref:CsbD-like domain-containing protein n=1 Tax=Aspergillus tanneri TaxID=1220188 RepID=A0A4V3UPG1_9EURO|nr:uncharacterized protein ATNIH1004_005176 [Aspergillus tanneri]KAA8649275.1 hypothetical protein ATNIH1004_005176 [Aspergillus tanneri]THC94984.1 hypothetical protein EYZ11_005537 [Aspergillus tanneri]